MAFFNSWRLCDLSEAGVSIMTFHEVGPSFQAARFCNPSESLEAKGITRHGIALRGRMTRLTVFYEIARPMAVAVA